jgi:hypothetical protein
LEYTKLSFLPAVLYGFQISSLTFREEHTLRVFEDRRLRRIFWPKRKRENKERLRKAALRGSA